MIIHIGHTVDMERYLHEQAFSQAVESGTCLIINANIESKIINFIMLDRPDLIAELYETNKLHSDARFINFDHFTGLQVASLYKAIETQETEKDKIGYISNMQVPINKKTQTKLKKKNAKSTRNIGKVIGGRIYNFMFS